VIWGTGAEVLRSLSPGEPLLLLASSDTVGLACNHAGDD
jgi:hypothetical protein